MGDVVDFVSLRCMREYEAVQAIEDQKAHRQQLKEWRQRYKRLLKDVPKSQKIRFWQKRNKL